MLDLASYSVSRWSELDFSFFKHLSGVPWSLKCWETSTHTHKLFNKFWSEMMLKSSRNIGCDPTWSWEWSLCRVPHCGILSWWSSDSFWSCRAGPLQSSCLSSHLEQAGSSALELRLKIASTQSFCKASTWKNLSFGYFPATIGASWSFATYV